MLKNYPETPGVYLFWAKDKPIYVGKAVNLKKRLKSYFRLRLGPKTSRMISRATRLTFLKVNSELEALLLEAKLIKLYQPKYNFIAKDDKHPLYITITNEEYPRVLSCRKPQALSSKLCYGPFPSSAKVYATLRALRKIIPFADHKKRSRPCLYSHLGLCRPCPNIITTQADRKQYLTNIRRIKNILDGHINRVVGDLTREMKEYSHVQNYEEAAGVKQQIENLNYITQKHLSEGDFLINPNLAADIRTEEINDLKKILIGNWKLEIGKLSRIECYDVSHLAGTFPTASMVTFINGEPERSLYRRFHLRNPKSQSDIDSLKEVASRRGRNFKKWGRPDLILVDGGLNQVRAFLSLGLPVVGIVKPDETLVTLEGRIQLPDGPARDLIVRIRNESHRFAQKYHNLLVKKDLFSPEADATLKKDEKPN